MTAGRSGYVLTTYLVDTSRTMSLSCAHDPSLSRIDLGLQYVRTRVSDQILRGLKTEHACVVLFGNDETRHGFTSSEGYENIYELIKPGTADTHILQLLQEVYPSKTNQGDLLTALMVATAIIMKEVGSKASWRREIVLVTDGESQTDWADAEQLREQMFRNNIDLVVAGIDFDDEQMGFFQKGKSAQKAENETILAQLVDRLEQRAILGNAQRAYEAILNPNPKIPSSASLNLQLRLGNPEESSTSSLEIDIVVKKATAKAAPMSMKKMIKKSAMEQRESPSKQKVKRDISLNEIDDLSGVDPPSRQPEDPSLPERRLYYFHVPKEEEPESLEVLDEEKTSERKRKGKEFDTEQQKKLKEPVFDPKKPSLERKHLVKAYRFGTTRVSVDDIDEQFGLTGKVGLDIIGFTPQASLPVEYKLGEVDYVFASPKSPKSQVAFSALIWAMAETQTLALGRIIRNSKSYAPKIGVLFPMALWNETGEKNIDLCYWARIPFMEDVRKYSFPSLEHLYTKSGKAVSEHQNLPTEEMQKSMDEFVDSMDLMKAGDEDEDENGNPIILPWMNDLNEAYNPSIHNIKNAVLARLANPINEHDLDKDKAKLPDPHPALTKFFDPPDSVLERSAKPLQDVTTFFNVKKVPKVKYHRGRKGEPEEEPEAIDLVDILGEEGDDKDGVKDPAMPSSSPFTQPYRFKESQHPPSSITKPDKSSTDRQPSKGKVYNNEDDVTTDEEEGEEEEGNDKAIHSEATEEGDDEKKPGQEGNKTDDEEESEDYKDVVMDSFISETDPIGDFNRLVASGGDVYTEIVNEMGKVIPSLIKKSFSRSQFGKAIECMQVTRKMAAEMDEAHSWNELIRSLKATVHDLKHGKDFWNEVASKGLGLLTHDEVVDAGIENTDLEISKEDADAFLEWD